MANVLFQTTPNSYDYIDWPPVDVVLDRYEAMTNLLDRLSTAGPQEPRPNGIGHNNPPPDPPRAPATWPKSDPSPLPKLEEVRFAQQIEAIVDSDYSAIWKLILLKVRLRCDHDTLDNAFASNATLMRAASVKDERTIREAVRDIIKDRILTREDRDGRAPSYGISKGRLQEIIADYIVANREKLQQRRRVKPLPSELLPSSVGGTSNGRGEPNEPPSSNGRRYPSHVVGGVSGDPSHFMQQPLPSNESRPSIPRRKGGRGADAPSPETNGKDPKAAIATALGGQAAYAHRNILIAVSGKISLGEEFRAELSEAYTDSQIERGLERAPSQVGGSTDRVKLLAQIRRCCSYAKQDDEKAAAKGQSQSTGRTFKR
jgi:hypothetical protein